MFFKVNKRKRVLHKNERQGPDLNFCPEVYQDCEMIIRAMGRTWKSK